MEGRECVFDLGEIDDALGKVEEWGTGDVERLVARELLHVKVGLGVVRWREGREGRRVRFRMDGEEYRVWREWW